MYLSGAALAAVIVASRLSGSAAQAVGALALVLQLLAAGAVAFTGKLGGELVYEHGANVRIAGTLVKDTGAGAKGEKGEATATPGDTSAAERAPKPDYDKDKD